MIFWYRSDNNVFRKREYSKSSHWNSGNLFTILVHCPDKLKKLKEYHNLISPFSIKSNFFFFLFSGHASVLISSYLKLSNAFLFQVNCSTLSLLREWRPHTIRLLAYMTSCFTFCLKELKLSHPFTARWVIF